MDTIIRLISEKCFFEDRLVISPAWLTWEKKQELVNSGLLIKEFNPNLYGHTEYFLGGEFFKKLDTSVKA